VEAEWKWVAASRLLCRSKEGKESEWGRRRSTCEEEMEGGSRSSTVLRVAGSLAQAVGAGRAALQSKEPAAGAACSRRHVACIDDKNRGGEPAEMWGLGFLKSWKI
jgi:hypothetical protein